MADHVRALLELKRRGAVVFDYGNNLRGQAQKAGVADAFEIGGFVPLYIRPLFCAGKGPFCWAALSGPSARSLRSTPSHHIPGIMTSRITASGFTSRALSRAAEPLDAV